MLSLQLPDGQIKIISEPMSVIEFAKTISTSLAKKAVAARVNQQLVDLSYRLTEDAQIQILTETDPEALEILRHSTAHLMAQAVKQLFPSAQMTIGPVIEDGFYYDFAFERSFTPEDLVVIEKKMQQLASENMSISRQEMSRQDAENVFKQQNEL
jgi:threonyl-tRNA synthetase